ncbi:PEP-CTERM sorting domain-containing protein [Kiritimatiellota bacterium B12222]|nr:PEP-CTERM sorting domain-containing protein [Kiritimatiellota bacterium B12222]
MKTTLLSFLTLLSASSLCVQAAVLLPYSNDFSSSVADFSTQGGSWNLSGGSYTNTDGSGSTSTATIDVTGIGGASPQDFTLTTTLSISGAGSNGNAHDTFGFALFGETASAPGSEYLLIDWSVNENMRILSIGGSGNGSLVNSSKSSTFNFANDTAYTMSLDFDYTGTDLVVTFGITDGINSDSLTSSSFSTSSALNSSYLAFRNREPINTTDGNLSVSYDELSIVAIPEPNTLAMMLISGLSLMVVGMRRRN